jgi:DNA-binding NarL/FixJ family response regulator
MTKDQKLKRVLIADDNQEMQNTVIALLGPEYEVVDKVSDGRALVSAHKEFNPDIAIVDISMPIMNGIQAVTEIKGNGSPTKVIFLTVNEDADFVAAALAAGGEGYVVKRKMASDLAKALEGIAEGKIFVSCCCTTQ